MLRAKAVGKLEIESFSISASFELLTNGVVYAELYLMGPKGDPVLVDRVRLSPSYERRHSVAKSLDPSLFCPGIQFLYLVPLRGTTHLQKVFTEIEIEVIWNGLA